MNPDRIPVAVTDPTQQAENRYLTIRIDEELDYEIVLPLTGTSVQALRELRDDLNRELGESPAKLSAHERDKKINGLLVELFEHFNLLHPKKALSTSKASAMIWSALSRYQSGARWVKYQRTKTMPVVQPAKATHQLVELYLLGKTDSAGRDPHIPSSRTIRRTLGDLRQAGQIGR